MKNNRKSFSQKKGILLFITVIMALFIYIYILPDVSDAFRRTDIIEYGVIQTKDDAECYIVRSETVFNASRTGTVQYYFSEGDRIRKGTKILDIDQGAEVCVADRRGLVSFYIDGQEQIFDPAVMKDLDQEKLKATEFETVDMYGNDAVTGMPLYKIVDSDIWYAIAWTDKKSIIKYELNGTVSLQFKQSQIRGKVKDIISKGDSFLVIMEFDRYWKEMPQLRKIDAEIITADYKGLMVRNESITKQNEHNGVYVKDVSGNYHFKPVKIITSDGKYSLVECGFYYENIDGESKRVETVDIYDEVLRNGKPD